ncbi:AAC-rich mRNA clone AAC11 -like protein [Labeo rohita]|uniref:AAC-rich mRNA clone AAC11-like protein n=1 Tax=Labeo rohita TaxID=84645 RepID=A0A498LBN1_LABRO|nr:AAC-rich mRNA clone AAC11 -like protein [Labeo rohita]
MINKSALSTDFQIVKDLNMASKTQILLLVVVMITTYGLTNCTTNCTTNGTSNCTTIGTTTSTISIAVSLSPMGFAWLSGLPIYTIISTAVLKLFQLM